MNIEQVAEELDIKRTYFRSGKTPKMREAFAIAENNAVFTDFRVSNNYHFPKVELNENTVKMPFPFMRFTFDKENSLILTKNFKDKGIVLKCGMVEILGAKNNYVIKLMYVMGKVEEINKAFGDDKPFIEQYFSFELDNMELKLHNGIEADYEEKNLAHCLELNMFENMYNMLQIIAFINTYNNEYKVVKREKTIKHEITGAKSKSFSKTIYLSKTAEHRLINSGEKRQYQKPRYAFRVRGHVRHLKHPKYKTDRKEMFIENYIKNTDKELFINKEYKL